MTPAPFGDLFSVRQGGSPAFAVFPVPAAQLTGKAESFGILCPEPFPREARTHELTCKTPLEESNVLRWGCWALQPSAWPSA